MIEALEVADSDPAATHNIFINPAVEAIGLKNLKKQADNSTKRPRTKPLRSADYVDPDEVPMDDSNPSSGLQRVAKVPAVTYGNDGFAAVCEYFNLLVTKAAESDKDKQIVSLLH